MIGNSLKEYLCKVHTVVDSLKNWDLSNSLEQTEATYNTMLAYLEKGINDPNLNDLYGKLWQTSIEIELSAIRQQRMQKSPNDKYCVEARENCATTQLPALLQSFFQTTDDTQCEEYTLRLFNSVWASSQWTHGDVVAAMDFIAEDSVPMKIKAVLISATTIALSEMFDVEKLLFLISGYLSVDTDISQRSLVGIVLALRQHNTLIPFYPEIRRQIEMLADDELFVSQTYNVLMLLQMSSLTDKVSNKIREDIMPAIQHASRETKHRMGMLEIREKMNSNGENPEWMESEDSNGASEEQERIAEEKMREMAEMQLKGEDIYMSTFCYMKGFPFFNKMAHWFYPFTTDEPLLKSITEKIGEQNNRLIQLLFNGSPFCNSDKFSLMMITENLGNEGVEGIASQMDAVVSDIEEDQRAELIDKALNRNRNANAIARSYIFDLYRFFMLYPYRAQFSSPFSDAQKNLFSPIRIKGLAPILKDNARLYDFADFLIRKQYYGEALDTLRQYVRNGGKKTAQYWQKKGFCHQKLDELANARECFINADAIKPNSKWTLSHLGRISIQLSDWKEATECYRQLVGMDEDNIQYLVRLAECLSKQKQYQNALERLYKAHYIDPSNTVVLSDIVHCLILSGEKEKALQYSLDGISRAIVHMLTGQMTDAISEFRNVYSQYKSENKSLTDFKYAIDRFIADIDTIDTMRLSLIIDAAVQV